MTRYATYYTIETETAKAVLHSEFGWLPKSQIEIINTPIGKMMLIPGWLKNKVSRSNYRYGKQCWWAMSDKEIAEGLELVAS